jgi:hypothetical protein
VTAGITNYDNAFRSSSDAELTYIYKHPSLFTDITQGGIRAVGKSQHKSAGERHLA